MLRIRLLFSFKISPSPTYNDMTTLLSLQKPTGIIVSREKRRLILP